MGMETPIKEHIYWGGSLTVQKFSPFHHGETWWHAGSDILSIADLKAHLHSDTLPPARLHVPLVPLPLGPFSFGAPHGGLGFTEHTYSDITVSLNLNAFINSNLRDIGRFQHLFSRPFSK